MLRLRSLESSTRASDSFTTASNQPQDATELAEAEASLAGGANASQTLNTAFVRANTLIDSELEAALSRLNDHFNDLIESYVQASQTSIGNFAQGVARLMLASRRIKGIGTSANQIQKVRLNSLALSTPSSKTSVQVVTPSIDENGRRITQAMSQINTTMETFAENFRKTTDDVGLELWRLDCRKSMR